MMMTTSTPGPTPSTRTQRIAIFGASRGVGRSALEQALAAGHHVVALMRNPDGFDVRHPQLTVVQGDVLDPAAVDRTLAGADGVLVALGAPALSRSRVRSEGTRAVMEGMKREGLNRLVCLSVYGAHESRASLPFFLRWVIFPTYLRRPVADHERQETLVRNSGLAYTLVRPPNLTDEPADGYVAGDLSPLGAKMPMKVSRTDVATFLIDAVANDQFVHEAPAITARPPA